jgi:pyruvate carboxylase
VEKLIKRLLVANRGEIAIRIFRACTELGITTVGIYAYEDRYSLHRYKCDESYLVGKDRGPVGAYLAIDEIVELAKEKKIDAIHPGYGFLSENPEFSRACEEAGIIFIGPHWTHIELFGDKLKAKKYAQKLGIPTIPGSDNIRTIDDVRDFARKNGYPIMIKATKGGGGRGIRIVKSESELETEYILAKQETLKAFHSDEIIVEKVIERPKHIEVQILGDKHGNVIHLFERDCSIQRRHQKITEIAPSISVPKEILEALYEDSIRFAREVGLYNAATFEYLVDVDNNRYYFLEVNPRIQVEHTVTEMITGIDIVQSQIKIAEGKKITDFIGTQKNIVKRGFSIQCRITTEDPENNFMPDTGKIEAYRSAVGFGIRLDAGNAYVGATITPYYDSLLVKVTSWGLTFEDSAMKMLRALKEFRIRGVKTNLRFLENLVSHPAFLKGDFRTNFLEEHPEIINIKPPRDRISKILRFLGNNIVNKPYGDIQISDLPTITVPKVEKSEKNGLKNILDSKGPKGVIEALLSEGNRIWFTDTTMRDAHQSLFATRMRTKDMIEIAPFYAARLNELFSIEMWGGATFDVAYRFLKEDPWERLALLREKVPNILFQMLFRGSNAVGYSNYPDNVIKAFVREAARSGIDVFRIFDCFNWLTQIKIPLEEVKKEGKIAEVAICYTGDILDPKEDKYTLKYYVDLAKEIERMGADIIAIKDMAGLLKPFASYKLFKTLSEEVRVPLHFHTHDTAGCGVASVLMAIEGGAKIVDGALSSMSGLTSQPSLNTIVEALEKSGKYKTYLDISALNEASAYFEKVRTYYYQFESDLKAPTAEVYEHEIPGGQYTNLRAQVKSVGLIDKWDKVKEMYKEVDKLLGRIIKVTPSSKVVGDLALFLVRNDLSIEEFVEKADALSLPNSVVEFFMGLMGQPYGGFNEELQRKILKGKEPLRVRPGKLLEDYNFESAKEKLKSITRKPIKLKDIISYALYDKVVEDYFRHKEEYGDVWVLSTKDFFFPLRIGEETTVNLEEGKTIYIKLISIGDADSKGYRTLVFEVNGETRLVRILDKSMVAKISANIKGDRNNPNHVIAPMPGKLVKILVKEGDYVTKNQVLAITEAMKIETKIIAPHDGIVKNIVLKEGSEIEEGDLIIEMT